jgi:hypothetical protein
MNENVPKIIMSKEKFKSELDRIDNLLSGIYYFISNINMDDDMMLDVFTKRDILDDRRAATKGDKNLTPEEVLERLNQILEEMKELAISAGSSRDKVSDTNLVLEYEMSTLEQKEEDGKNPTNH